MPYMGNPPIQESHFQAVIRVIRHIFCFVCDTVHHYCMCYTSYQAIESARASATPGGYFSESKRGPFGAEFGLLFTSLCDAQTPSQRKQQGMSGKTFISSCHF